METLYEKLPGPLLTWYREHARKLPWRVDQDPYHVWLSEVMLQQTRVEAVKDYYIRFLESIPGISQLAQASDDQLTKLWEGLGYYSRVRNLQKAAKIIMENHGGQFPREYAQVRALPGIGDYTAGAICSICFQMPTPAVDGNVLRVLSRLEASFAPIDQPMTKKCMTEKLKCSYAQGNCGDLTQSLMELGATLCGPNRAPQCHMCPLESLCQAKALQCQEQLPVKSKKQTRKLEEKTVFLLRNEQFLAICKRPATGLLAGLWSYPIIDGHLTVQEALDWVGQAGCQPKELLKTVEKVHVFTHVQWNMQGIYLICGARPDAFHWVTDQQLQGEIGLPTAFRQFSEDQEVWTQRNFG